MLLLKLEKKIIVFILSSPNFPKGLKVRISISRYRMLDTRVKFIFLYNIRLFEKDLYYLWKRIINVVFIREYEGTTRDITKQKYPWFELITVPFPAPVSTVLVPRRLDTYSRGTFRKKVDLFREKTTDLKNQTLKVVTFSHTPGSRKNVNCFNSTGNSCSKQMIMELYSGAEVEVNSHKNRSFNLIVWISCINLASRS
ncbi:hypothetical protein WA026_022151 [Henosepilachna vigintioctopunctata]|uniref:Uncharacterized protein n=1 Tax=Henosepilachna vigintioctopunctata TaxID=420089 RepID=A0AAW1U045_9CUCU